MTIKFIKEQAIDISIKINIFPICINTNIISYEESVFRFDSTVTYIKPTFTSDPFGQIEHCNKPYQSRAVLFQIFLKFLEKLEENDTPPRLI